MLRNTGSAHLVENVEIVVDDGAHLTVVTLQEWDDDAIHLASHFARIGRDAQLKHIVVSLGGSRRAGQPVGPPRGSGVRRRAATASTSPTPASTSSSRSTCTTTPRTAKSRVNYKGALQGAGARTVWIGDVLIGRTAPGTDSYEQNRNLVLTEGTRADSIPNLEIETGDIVGAGHASATGRFDDEHLFYLQSRGITEERRAASSCSASSARSCRRSASPTSRSASSTLSRPN